MKSVLQRVARAEVRVEGSVVGSIERGLMLLVGVAEGDTDADADALASKVAALRIFEDDAGKMNLSVADVAGSVLAISQFTLLADTSRGRRPSFTLAMRPPEAERLFDRFCETLRSQALNVETGRFGASMQVELVNDGPVTILLDTKNP